MRWFARLLAIGFIGLATAVSAQPMGEEEVRFGTIVRIDPVALEGDHQLGIGSVIGAVAGGVIGHQFGGGTGRDVATVLGALGGGLLGTKVQNQYAEKRAGQFVTVKLRNGVSVGITQPADPNLRVGDSVRIDGSGPSARVVRV